MCGGACHPMLSPNQLENLFFNFWLIIYDWILAYIKALMMPQLTKKYSLAEFDVFIDKFSKEFFEKLQQQSNIQQELQQEQFQRICLPTH